MPIFETIVLWIVRASAWFVADGGGVVKNSDSERGSAIQQAHAFFDHVMDPYGIVELRVFEASNPVGSNRGFQGPRMGYFDDAEMAAVEALNMSERWGARAVSATINPVLPDLRAQADGKLVVAKRGGATRDEHILKRRLLFIDIDAAKPAADMMASEAEQEAALLRGKQVQEYLEGLGWPKPRLVAHSGNGLALYYGIDLPNDEASLHLVGGVLTHLSNRFDDPSAHVDRSVKNAARTARVPGTWNRKGDDFAGKGTASPRPWRRCELVENNPDAPAVGGDLLRAIAHPETDSPMDSQRVHATNQPPLDPSPYRRWIAYCEKTPDSVSGKNGHGALLRWACEGRRFGLTDAELLRGLEELNRTKADPPWSRRELEHKVAESAKMVPPDERGIRLREPRPGSLREPKQAPPGRSAEPSIVTNVEPVDNAHVGRYYIARPISEIGDDFKRLVGPIYRLGDNLLFVVNSQGDGIRPLRTEPELFAYAHERVARID